MHFVNKSEITLEKYLYMCNHPVGKKAKKKLKRCEKVKVIGITGSYAKTTVKNILCTILSEKFKKA